MYCHAEHSLPPSPSHVSTPLQPPSREVCVHRYDTCSLSYLPVVVVSFEVYTLIAPITTVSSQSCAGGFLLSSSLSKSHHDWPDSHLLSLKALPRQWVARETANLQSLRSRKLTSVSPFFLTSLLMVSTYHNFGLPPGLTPSTTMSSTRDWPDCCRINLVLEFLMDTFLSHTTAVTLIHSFHAWLNLFLQSPVFHIIASMIAPRNFRESLFSQSHFMLLIYVWWSSSYLLAIHYSP